MNNIEHSRPSWDEYFLELAKVVSTRATCNRAKHGCIIVRNRIVISSGYNGSPIGFPHCIDGECLMLEGHCMACEHAERNAIYQAAKYGSSSLEGCTAYITGDPCINCLRAFICAGVEKIVYKESGHYPYSKDEEKVRQYFMHYSNIKTKGM